MSATFDCMRVLISRFATIAMACVVIGTLAAPASGQTNAVDCERVEESLKLDPQSLSEEQFLMLAISFDVGECVDQSFEKAFEFYLRVAGGNGELIKARLGHFYLDGLGVERNEETARIWFRSHALSWSEDLFKTGEIYELLYEVPIPQMLKEEIARARQDRESGSVEIWMQNYRDLTEGNGVVKSLRGARAWLHLAVQAEHPEAIYESALVALRIGDESLYRTFIGYASRIDYPPAHIRYGKFFLDEDDDEYNPYLALVWFLRAQVKGMEVSELIRDALSRMAPEDREQALKNAARFNFGFR